MRHWLWYDKTGAVRGDLVYTTPLAGSGGWPEHLDLNAPKAEPCPRCVKGVEFAPCRTCHARGYMDTTRVLTCPICKGKDKACPQCNGTGQRHEQNPECPTCKGATGVPVGPCPECSGRGERVDAAVVAARAHFPTLPDFGGFIAYDCKCHEVLVRCHCSAHRCGDSVVVGGQLQKKPKYQVEIAEGGKFDHDARVDVTPGARARFRLVGADMRDGTVMEVSEDKTKASVLAESPIHLTFSGSVTEWAEFCAPAQGSTGHLLFRPVQRKDGQAQRLRVRGWTK